jgi:hypothetical protein
MERSIRTVCLSKMHHHILRAESYAWMQEHFGPASLVVGFGGVPAPSPPAARGLAAPQSHFPTQVPRLVWAQAPSSSAQGCRSKLTLLIIFTDRLRLELLLGRPPPISKLGHRQTQPQFGDPISYFSSAKHVSSAAASPGAGSWEAGLRSTPPFSAAYSHPAQVHPALCKVQLCM